MGVPGAVSYDVKVWTIQKVPGKRGTAYRLRWTVADRRCSQTFATVALADSRRAELITASRRGEAFDVASGLPVSMLPDERETTWWEWLLTYVDLKWPALAPNSRRSTAESLVTATMALLPERRRRPPDAQLRSVMFQWAFNARRRAAGPVPEPLNAAASWLEANSRPLHDLEDAALTRSVLDAISRKQDGTRAAATTIARKRAVLHNVLELAVERELLAANPLDRIRWKPPKVNDTFDLRAVVNPHRTDGSSADPTAVT